MTWDTEEVLTETGRVHLTFLPLVRNSCLLALGSAFLSDWRYAGRTKDRKLMITNRRRQFEMISAFATGLGKFFFFDLLGVQFWYILIVGLFWIFYVYSRIRKEKELLKYWGFRKGGIRETLRIILPLFVLAVFAFAFYGWYTSRWILNWHIFPTLLLYPLWGLVQQFLILALVAGNLQDLEDPRIPTTFIVLITATLFSIIHYPSYLLMGGTFLLAIIYTLLYLRFRNLWVLGLFHGWTGCLFFFLVLEKDPWAVFVHSI